MAEKIDEEGNIISPLGSFKKLSTIAPAVSQPTAIPAKTPLPVPAQSPHPTSPLANLDRKPAINTTKLCDDRHVWKVRAPALPALRDLRTASAAPAKISLNPTRKPVLKQLATASAIARAPKTGGVMPLCWEQVNELELKLEKSFKLNEESKLNLETKVKNVNVLLLEKDAKIAGLQEELTMSKEHKFKLDSQNSSLQEKPVITPKLNVLIQNILAQERKEMKQMFAEKHLQLEDKLRDDLRCRCGDKQVVPADHVPTVPLTTCPATASTISESKDETQQNRSVVAPLVTSWVTLLSHLRSDTIEQMKKLQKANKNKDNQIASKVSEIKKLKNRVACLVHEDNLEHLERQQSQTSYSSSDCASVSSNSSYKESSCESSNRQTKPVTGHQLCAQP